MQKHDDHIPDEKLAKLLSSLKTEPVFPEDFEERFLQEMHRRRTQEPVRRPVTTSLGTFISDMFRAKWVYGAATAVTAVAILAIIIFDSKPASNLPAVASSGDSTVLQPVGFVKEQNINPDEKKDEQDQSKQKENEADQMVQDQEFEAR